MQLVKESKLRTSTDIRELFEDGQKFVAIELSHNQEEKMAVADSGGCAQEKIDHFCLRLKDTVLSGT